MQGRFDTEAVRTGFPFPDPHNALQMPVYENVAFGFASAEDMVLAFAGRAPAHVYSRISNPTVQYFETRISRMTGAPGVMAFSSGMAAISSLLVSIAGSGDNIITFRFLFGNTRSLFEKTFAPWGLEVRYADVSRPSSVTALIDENTRAVFFETITNPQLQVADIGALAAVTADHGIPLVADTTLTPFPCCDARKLGIGVEIVSATKFISGGGTATGGLLLDHGTCDWNSNPYLKRYAPAPGPAALLSRLRTESYRNLGGCMSPHTAHLLTIGLETLGLRVARACDSARHLAGVLAQHPAFTSVNYPGSPDHPAYGLVKNQFNGNGGSVLTVTLASKETCFSFINRLKLIQRATNLHDNRTLVLHPASTIFAEYDPGERAGMGVAENMVRFAVGLEDPGDLLHDINQALEEL